MRIHAMQLRVHRSWCTVAGAMLSKIGYGPDLNSSVLQQASTSANTRHSEALHSVASPMRTSVCTPLRRTEYTWVDPRPQNEDYSLVCLR